MKASILAILKKHLIAFLLSIALIAALLVVALFASKTKTGTFYAKYDHLRLLWDETVFDLYKDEKAGKDAEVYDWVRFVWEDGKCYRISDEGEAVEVSEGEYSRQVVFLDVSGMKRTDAGKGEFDGVPVDYETFEDEGWKQTYYFGAKGGLEGYEVIDKDEPEEIYKTVRVVLYDNDVPKDVFDVPQDYRFFDYGEDGFWDEPYDGDGESSDTKMGAFYDAYDHLKVDLDGSVIEIYKGGKVAELFDGLRGVWEWNGSTCYMIDGEARTVELSDEYLPEIAYMDLEGMALTDTGKGKFGGKQLDYETYEDEGWKQTYYFDADGGLKGYVIVDLEEPDEIFKTVQVLAYDDKVPAGVFDVPEDYEFIGDGAVG